MMTLFYNEPAGKLLLRLGLATTLLLHGIAKVGNSDAVAHIGTRLQQWGVPGQGAWLVFVGELVAPLMILLGWRARLGGGLAAINMLVAIVLFKLDALFSLNRVGGWSIELEVLLLCAALAVLFIGSGRYAVRPD
ncbi:putative oxidoreductase [Kushneria sinocarnis]|uniref:Putative oxidoreductase n=1 Tax=Kushneria sinocarnis TaxID=595502 RepID=A0A420WTX0_9GAMM|nr:DoxX family protein [Kushneria sinocarnis]RKQ96856.1 putative oxidoreductase [Kushneria sinocarnis]